MNTWKALVLPGAIILGVIFPGLAVAAHDDHEEHAGYNEHEGEAGHFIELSSSLVAEFDIVVSTASSTRLFLETTLPGEIQVNAERLAHIVPRYPGLVIEVRKSIGDLVKKGDVLAVLEGNESLAPYELTALIEGTIIDKHITLGEALRDDEPAFTVADLSKVWVNITLFQRDLSLVRIGQKVHVTGGAHSGSSDGVISYVSPILDEQTRTGHARIVLNNRSGLWKPGQFVTGTVELDDFEVEVGVPQTAIEILDGRPSVFIREGDEFMPREVYLGRKDRRNVEILDGLATGEKYVSRNGFVLKAELSREELDSGHEH